MSAAILGRPTSFAEANDCWLAWYRRGQADAARTLADGSRWKPCSTWQSDQRAWRLGFSDAIFNTGY